MKNSVVTVSLFALSLALTSCGKKAEEEPQPKVAAEVSGPKVIDVQYVREKPRTEHIETPILNKSGQPTDLVWIKDIWSVPCKAIFTLDNGTKVEEDCTSSQITLSSKNLRTGIYSTTTERLDKGPRGYRSSYTGFGVGININTVLSSTKKGD